MWKGYRCAWTGVNGYWHARDDGECRWCPCETAAEKEDFFLAYPSEAVFLEPVALVFMDEFHRLSHLVHTLPGSSCLEYLLTQTWVLWDKRLEKQHLKYAL